MYSKLPQTPAIQPNTVMKHLGPDLLRSSTANELLVCVWQVFYWGRTHKAFKSDPLVIVAFCRSDFFFLFFFLTSRPLSPSCRRSKTFYTLYSHHQSYATAHLSAEHAGEERLYSLLERTWSKTRLWNKWQRRPSETPRADSKKKKKMHWGEVGNGGK